MKLASLDIEAYIIFCPIFLEKKYSPRAYEMSI